MRNIWLEQVRASKKSISLQDPQTCLRQIHYTSLGSTILPAMAEAAATAEFAK